MRNGIAGPQRPCAVGANDQVSVGTSCPPLPQRRSGVPPLRRWGSGYARRCQSTILFTNDTRSLGSSPTRPTSPPHTFSWSSGFRSAAAQPKLRPPRDLGCGGASPIASASATVSLRGELDEASSSPRKETREREVRRDTVPSAGAWGQSHHIHPHSHQIREFRLVAWGRVVVEQVSPRDPCCHTSTILRE